MPWPLIVAHRGYSARAPENTLAALRLALDAGAPAWVAPYDFAHHALTEVDYPREKTDENDAKVIEALVGATKRNITEDVLSGLTSLGPGSVIWPKFINYRRILPAIKSALDHNNVANPGRIIDPGKVLAMEEHHRQAAVRMAPEFADRIHLLSRYAEHREDAPPMGVPDPIGGDLEEYRSVFRIIHRYVMAAVPRIEREILDMAADRVPRGGES